MCILHETPPLQCSWPSHKLSNRYLKLSISITTCSCIVFHSISVHFYVPFRYVHALYQQVCAVLCTFHIIISLHVTHFSSICSTLAISYDQHLGSSCLCMVMLLQRPSLIYNPTTNWRKQQGYWHMRKPNFNKHRCPVWTQWFYGICGLPNLHALTNMKGEQWHTCLPLIRYFENPMKEFFYASALK